RPGNTNGSGANGPQRVSSFLQTPNSRTNAAIVMITSGQNNNRLGMVVHRPNGAVNEPLIILGDRLFGHCSNVKDWPWHHTMVEAARIRHRAEWASVDKEALRSGAGLSTADGVPASSAAFALAALKDAV